MKNTVKLLGIIVIAAVIGFSMAGCDGDDTVTSGPTSLGEEATLTGKVCLISQNRVTGKYTYPAYSGKDLTVSVDGYQKTGTITGGQFSFPLETPDYLEDLDEESLGSFFSGYKNVTASPSTAKVFIIESFEIKDSENSLRRVDYTINGSRTSATMTMAYVMYVYVDKDVTVSGTGYTDIDIDEEDGYTWTEIYKDFTLSLKTGWNTVCLKRKGSMNRSSSTYTITLSLSNPGNLKWVLMEKYGYDEDDD